MLPDSDNLPVIEHLMSEALERLRRFNAACDRVLHLLLSDDVNPPVTTPYEEPRHQSQVC